MGGCNSSAGVDQEELEKHRQIEKELREDRKGMTTETKVSSSFLFLFFFSYLSIQILLLGAGDTGKSTLIKQIKLIYKSGFSEEERNIFRFFPSSLYLTPP